MNFMRKSTDGWSIGLVLLDFFGGIANYLQMIMQSIDQGVLSPLQTLLSLYFFFFFTLNFELTFFTLLHIWSLGSWKNIYGNIGKLLVAVV